MNANLLVTGAYEDANRVPTISKPLPDTTTGARTTDLAFDRLTPVAMLQLGFRLRFFQEKLGIQRAVLRTCSTSARTFTTPLTI